MDAGHSAAHTEEFYNALREEGLPLPSLTVLTHWHWDHSFGMHAVNGLTIANRKTNQYLLGFQEKIMMNGSGFFLDMHETIRKEYSNNTPVIVKPADIVFEGELLLDAGNCPIRLFQAESPHTDDATLVHIIDEKFLFIGDANCGEFPSGIKDKELVDKYLAPISSSDVDRCLEGHWTPDTLEGIIEDILN